MIYSLPNVGGYVCEALCTVKEMEYSTARMIDDK